MSGAEPPSKWIAAWMTLAVVDVVYVLAALPSTDVVNREIHLVYVLGHFGALGVVCAGAARLARGLSGRRRLGLAWALAVLVGAAVLYPDLHGPARRLAARLGGGQTILQVLLLVGFAASIPVALHVGERLSRTRLRWVGPAVAVGIGVHNQLVFRFDVPGFHLFYAWTGAALMARALAGTRLLPPVEAPRARRLVRVLTAVAGLGVGFTILVPPPNLVLVDMSRASASVLFPFWAPVHARLGGPEVEVGGELGPWFVDRSGLPDRPPSADELIVERPIVIVISVDAVRADVFADPGFAAALPNLAALRGRSTVFTQARAPGAATVYTMAMMFSGKYFSQLYWSPKLAHGTRDLWPHEDASPRFPELLGRAGVHTFTAAPTFWLTNEFGLVGGFTEQVVTSEGESIAPNGASHWSAAGPVVDRLIARLAEPPERMFAFVHLLEPHAPYEGASRDPRARYLDEIARVDAEIGRILAAIEAAGLSERVVLVFTSDHGEAFGEHGSRLHATTLYEEQLRVPLWIAVPGRDPGRVEVPVSLIDLGPTVLDLFGVGTPATYMGESLRPALVGEPLALTRPIIAEGRRMHAIISGGRYKVIRDSRAGTVEAYDLQRDPGELSNLYRDDGARADDLAMLQAFFEVHTHRRPGYEVPLRK